MHLPIDELRKQLGARNLDLSHIALRNNGETAFLVNDVFLSPADAERVAPGVDTIDELRRRGEAPSGPTGFAWIATAAAITPAAKAIYDVTKDGWEKLKPSPHIRIDILDSESEKGGHIVTVSVINLSGSGIYIDSVSIARIVDESQKLSIKQPTVRFEEVNDSSLRDPTVTPLPILPQPDIPRTFKNAMPSVIPQWRAAIVRSCRSLLFEAGRAHFRPCIVYIPPAIAGFPTRQNITAEAGPERE